MRVRGGDEGDSGGIGSAASLIFLAFSSCSSPFVGHRIELRCLFATSAIRKNAGFVDPRASHSTVAKENGMEDRNNRAEIAEHQFESSVPEILLNAVFDFVSLHADRGGKPWMYVVPSPLLEIFG